MKRISKHFMYIHLYQDIESLEYSAKMQFPVIDYPSFRVKSVTVESFGHIPSNTVKMDIRINHR